MKTQKISVRQATMWFTLCQFGSAFLLLSGVLAAVAKQDAWISVVVALCFYFLLLPLYTSISKQQNGHSFDEHLIALFGNMGGKIFLFLFIICYPFLILVTVFRDLGDFLTISVLTATPIEAVYGLMLLAVIYAVRAGITVVGRVAEILFFIVFALIIIAYFSLIPSMDMTNIQPIFEQGWKPIVLASFPLIAFPYIESVLFLFFVPYIKEASKWKKVLVKGSLISGTVFLMITFITIAVLSEGVVSNLVYPSYFVVRTISIADFLERFEILISVLWYITMFFRLAWFLYISAYGFSKVFSMQSSNSLLIPLALIAIIMANVIWGNTTELINTFKVWHYYSAVFAIIAPLFLWSIGWIKAKKIPTKT